MSEGIFSHANFNAEAREPWQIRVNLIVMAERQYDEIMEILNPLKVDYVEHLKPSQLDAIQNISALAYNTAACLLLRSGRMQEMIKSQASRDEIIEVHAAWISSNIERWQKRLSEFRSLFGYLKSVRSAPIDADALKERYTILFDQLLPQEVHSLRDL